MNKKTKGLRVTHAQSVYDDKELKRVVSVIKEHRTLMGRELDEFETRVAKLFGKKYGIMVNSGSSANLVAVELLGLEPGSEVITPVLTFSTTVAPLLKRGLIPVFVDVKEGTYLIDVDKIEKAITKKTKAMMIPIMFGNVPNMEKLAKIARKYKLKFIDDSCDALVSHYKGKPTGAYTDISTCSFYGSHIITAGGGGGIVVVNSDEYRNGAKMLRGWGRSSSLFNESESIESRFSRNIDGIPYDGKFIFDSVGYNFLPLEISAAFGNAQLDKLKSFVKTRERNFKFLKKFFDKYSEYFITPVIEEGAQPQWQVFAVTIRQSAPFTRLEFVKYLEENNVQTRPLATGNILRQPGFKNIPHRDSAKEYPFTDAVMEGGFMVGVHQGLTPAHLARLKEVVESFFKSRKNS